MKKFLSILPAILFIAFFFNACGSDATSDMESLMKKQANVLEKCSEGMEKAQGADDVVKAIEAYTAGMKELLPELQEFQKKYPDYEKGVAPKDLEDEIKRVEQATARFQAAMMNNVRFMMDARVQEAMSRMGKEMGEVE
jgi:PBP1b-binding outer membrane lipoprotein LpoB